MKKFLSWYDISNYKRARISIGHRFAYFFIVYEDQAAQSTVIFNLLTIEAFIWMAIYVYLDLTYLVGILSQFYKIIKPAHVQLIKHVL